MLETGLQYANCAKGVGVQIGSGIGKRQADGSLPCDMHDGINATHENAIQHDRITDIADDELCARWHVFVFAGSQIINRNDLMPLGEQQFRNVPTDKACPASYQNAFSHVHPLLSLPPGQPHTRRFRWR